MHQSALRSLPNSSSPVLPASLLLGLYLLSPPVLADSAPRFELGLFAERHGISETRGTSHLVDEHGTIPSAKGRVIIPFSSGAFAIGYAASDGHLHYDGQTQSGQAFQTTTKQRISRSTVTYSHPITANFHLRLGLELETRNRRIRGKGNVLGLNEDYRHQHALAGLQYRASWGYTQLDLLASLDGSQSISSKGAIDTVTIPSNGARGIRLQATLPLVDANSNTHLHWVPQIEYLHTPRSDAHPYSNGGMPAGTISQPETRRWSASLGLALSW